MFGARRALQLLYCYWEEEKRAVWPEAASWTASKFGKKEEEEEKV